MPRSSRAASGLPPQSQRAITRLGKDIALARRRRKLPQRLMAERMIVSVQTLQRLEAGDPTVGLAVLASALHVLGMTNDRFVRGVKPNDGEERFLVFRGLGEEFAWRHVRHRDCS